MSDDPINYGKPIDDDYIDVEKRRADVSTTDEEPDDSVQRDRQAAHHSDMSGFSADMSYFFDVGSGNGAASQTDELIDENAVISHDGRAPTRTFFYTVEAPEEKRQQYRRLYRHQEGVGDPDRRAQNRPADRRRAVDTFCGELDMNSYHRERVKHVIEGIEMSHMAHYSGHKVILAVISLVANEDGRFIRDEDAFRGLMRDIGTNLSELKSVRGLVRRKSERL